MALGRFISFADALEISHLVELLAGVDLLDWCDAQLLLAYSSEMADFTTIVARPTDCRACSASMRRASALLAIVGADGSCQSTTR